MEDRIYCGHCYSIIQQWWPCVPKTSNNFKVAHVIGALSGAAGGAPRTVADMIMAIQSQGAKVTLFTGHNNKLPLTPEVFGLQDCEIVSGRLIGPAVLGLSTSLAQLAKRAREFDVIHLNGAWNLTTSIAASIARRAAIPYILTSHSHLGAYHFTRHPLLKRILFRLVEQQNVQRALAIHVTCQWEEQTSRPALEGSRVITIPHPVKLEGILPLLSRSDARAALGLAPDIFAIVFFGRVARQKNPLFLLDAFHRANLPQNARLFFVGPSELPIEKQLHSHITRNGLASRVTMVPYATGDTKRAWLAAGDVFALPSSDDNFSVATFEAAASGTHCLLSPHVGASEYLPGPAVDIVPLDMTLWINRIEALALNPPPQQPLPPEYIQRLTPERIGREWIDFYTSSFRGTTG